MHPITVLLVEDDEADAYLISSALQSVWPPAKVIRAKDGEKALDLLLKGEISPDIGFVDLKMPNVSGHTLLSECYHAGLAAFPIVVLTSSSVRDDEIASAINGSARFMTKPASQQQLRLDLRNAIEDLVPAPDVWG